MRWTWIAPAVLALTAAAAAPGVAQNNVGISYDWSTPMGDTKNFVDNDSWLGFTLDFRHSQHRESNKYFGATLGYYELYNMDPAASTIQFGPTAVNGQQYRHAFVIPMMLNGTFYFGGNAYKPRPYLGLNAGASWIKQTVDVGIYTLTSDAIVVAGMPELGVAIPTRGGTMFNLHVRYHIPFGSDNLYSQGGSGASLQYLSVGIGLMGRP